jgi:hypothetical protein
MHVHEAQLSSKVLNSWRVQAVGPGRAQLRGVQDLSSHLPSSVSVEEAQVNGTPTRAVSKRLSSWWLSSKVCMEPSSRMPHSLAPERRAAGTAGSWGARACVQWHAVRGAQHMGADPREFVNLLTLTTDGIGTILICYDGPAAGG